ncbi:hypothetical protein CI102_14252 [Trichoderma harzianum]|uniref:Uncharacterized protein n=1 Tax=Trichoderma harzianum CBS 226.95 TaxID=983964 RepID=A0A2T4ARS3_TRIHA|nr:hypothetical protein M431DRAFT_314570 [Trichoderma harzianum CBS 226.95]PKK40826.1 hypothetical protein CI102_14252 [Trichoderma harzianum]PTB59771.1 hypothetical protein M431DRAFT_314570 [Trichoderma harzianum CBS 226.95]
MGRGGKREKKRKWKMNSKSRKRYSRWQLLSKLRLMSFKTEGRSRWCCRSRNEERGTAESCELVRSGANGDSDPGLDMRSCKCFFFLLLLLFLLLFYFLISSE